MAYKVEKTWTTQAGYIAVCIAIENMHRCGYVGLPPEHPLHGIEYSQNTPVLKDAWEKAKTGPVGKRGIIELFCVHGNDEENTHPSLVFDVHGGITYSGGKDYPIKNKNGLWWFGFDCGHNGDGYFEGSSMASYLNGPIRSVEYVMKECESLAKQLKDFNLIEANKK